MFTKSNNPEQISQTVLDKYNDKLINNIYFDTNEEKFEKNKIFNQIYCDKLFNNIQNYCKEYNYKKIKYNFVSLNTDKNTFVNIIFVKDINNKFKVYYSKTNKKQNIKTFIQQNNLNININNKNLLLKPQKELLENIEISKIQEKNKSINSNSIVI